jgi:hypothetical protein
VYYGAHKNYLEAAERIFNEFNTIVGYEAKKPKKELVEIKPK